MIVKYKTTREARKARTRKRLRTRGAHPRLSVFRSNQHIYAQIIDDEKGVTLVAASDNELKGDKIVKQQKAAAVGALLSEKAKKAKVLTVMFDRGPYKYHGRIKALAEAARKGGLKF